tara:strand:- start:378 stop:1826 length:1449 start_codon:yes stop_codon:yes gene_type:complete
MKIFLIIFLFFSFEVFSSDALIIGISDYKNSPLKNPVNDAKLLSNRLKSYGWNVTLVLNPNSRELESSLKKFSRSLNKRNTNSSLVYFSGHGFQYFGENYLVPVGTSDSSIIKDSFSISEIIKFLDKFNHPKILIVDACRTPILDPDNIPISIGLNSQPAPKNTLIAYATAPGKIAYDGEGRYSPYALSLSDALENSFNIGEVFLNTRINTIKITEGEQIPWETSSLVENISFAVNSAKPEFNNAQTASNNFENIGLVAQNSVNQLKLDKLTKFNEALDYLIQVVESSGNSAFFDLYPNYELSSEFLEVKADIIEDLTSRKNRKDLDRYVYFGVVNSLQDGIINPPCRDKGKLDLNCINMDKVFVFKPDLELALKLAEIADKKKINSSILARHYRYGWVVKKDLLKAYDLYIKDRDQNSEYYWTDINEMIQEELFYLGYEIDIDGDFGKKSCLALESVIGKINCKKIPSRENIKEFISKVSL